MLTFSRVWLTLETVLIFCKNIRLVLWIGFQAQTVFNTGLLSLWKTPRKVLMLFNFADLNGNDRELNMEHYMSARRYGISLRKFSSIAWMSRVTLASLSEWICWFLNLPWVYSIKGNLAQPIYHNATKTIRKKNIEHSRLYLYSNLTMSR